MAISIARRYVRAVWRHWSSLLGGAAAAVVFLIIAEVFEVDLPPLAWIGVLLVALLVAQFQAWLDLERELTTVEQASTPDPGPPAFVPAGVVTAEPMPTSVHGYRRFGLLESDELRVFDRERGSTIIDFAATMNGGTRRLWFVRWRSLGLPVQVGLARYDYASYFAVGEGTTEVTEWSAPAMSGLVRGTWSEQPVFALPEDAESLTDVSFELQWWEAAP